MKYGESIPGEDFPSTFRMNRKITSDFIALAIAPALRSLREAVKNLWERQ